MYHEERLVFDKETFFLQLLKHRVMTEEEPEKYLKEGAPQVATLLRLLDRKVYRASFDKVVNVNQLNAFPTYKDLLSKWGKLVSTEYENGQIMAGIKLYALEPIYSESIRCNYYDKWKNDKNVKFSLEFVISFCLACGVDDPRYIYQAINAFCDESLDGKGLRKILLQGAIMGCWAFGDIAYNGVKTGLMESYYEQFLTNPANKKVVDLLENVIICAPDKDASDEMVSGTTFFVKMAAKCMSADDFARLLNHPIIQRGALSDLIDTTYLVKGFISKREPFLDCSASGYAARYNIQRATYSDFTHGRCGRKPYVFLRLAVVFGFTQEEFDLMIHSMHFIDGKNFDFDLCTSGARQICGFDRRSEEYRSACARLTEAIRDEVKLNADDLPVNPGVRSFYKVLMMITEEPR